MIREYIPIFERKMALLEGEGGRIIGMFNREIFNLWNFKLETRLSHMDLWSISIGLEPIMP
jgi:hypothetical protein